MTDPIVAAWNLEHPGLTAGAILVLAGPTIVRSLGYARGGYVVVADCRYDHRDPAVTWLVASDRVTPTGQRVSTIPQ